MMPEELLKGKKQKIMQIWKNNPKRWIQSAELRRKFVLDYNKEWDYDKDSSNWLNVKTGEKVTEKPLPYVVDGEFYRDLTLLADEGILDKKREPQRKGKDKVYYRPNKRYRLLPLKSHYATLIKDRSMDHIYHGLQYLLFLPENLTTKEFLEERVLNLGDKTPLTPTGDVNVKRAFLLESLCERFMADLELLLLDTRLAKVEWVWNKKINDNKEIILPLKIYLRTQLLISFIIYASPLFYQVVLKKKTVSELEDKFADEKRHLHNMIFWDTARLIGYTPEDTQGMVKEIKENFNNKWGYISKVQSEVFEILETKEFGIMLCPPITKQLKEKDKNVKPDFLNTFEQSLEQFLDQLCLDICKQPKEQLLKNLEDKGILKLFESGKVERIKKKDLKDTGVLERVKKMEKMESDSDSSRTPEIKDIGIDDGKDLFDNYSPYVRKVLKDFCKNLKYNDREMYRALFLFSFPLPSLR